MQVHFLTKNFGKYDTSSIGSYMNVGGFEALRKAVTMDPEAITDLLSAVKIKGRGGAEYPLGRKWSQARAVRGERKVVICNADEGETTTFKDRELICHDPFNLIEAMIIAAYVVGASDGFIYMRAEYACYRPLLLNAIRQAKNYGFLGTNILGRGFDFDIHLYSGAGAYVCGEGTALIRSIEGKAGRPRMKPPFIKVSGEILYDLAGGIQHDRKIQLIQFGGASGKIADASILDTPYTYEDLRAAGVMVGSGGMLVIDERTSVLDFLRMNQEFFWEESCGQCTPCREGNLHIKIILDKMAAGTATREDIAIMIKIARVMSMSSLCGLGETAQNTLMSAMKVFPDLFDIGGARA